MKEHITCIYTHGNIVQNFSNLCFIFSIERINAKLTAGALSLATCTTMVVYLIKQDSVHGKTIYYSNHSRKML